jgi:hypothetical protein
MTLTLAELAPHDPITVSVASDSVNVQTWRSHV